MDGSSDWTDFDGGKIFTSANDKNTITKNRLENPIRCTALRIVCIASKSWASMRSELLISI